MTTLPYVYERILVHLIRNAPSDPDPMGMHPFAICDDGIAQACGLSRAHVSIECKKLVNVGLVKQYKAHIEGGRTVRIVRIPTDNGVLKGRSIERMYQREGIEVLAPVELKMGKVSMFEKMDDIEKRIQRLEDAARRAGVLV